MIEKLKEVFGDELKEIKIQKNVQLDNALKLFINKMNEAHKATSNSKIVFK